MIKSSKLIFKALFFSLLIAIVSCKKEVVEVEFDKEVPQEQTKENLLSSIKISSEFQSALSSEVLNLNDVVIESSLSTFYNVESRDQNFTVAELFLVSDDKVVGILYGVKNNNFKGQNLISRFEFTVYRDLSLFDLLKNSGIKKDIDVRSLELIGIETYEDGILIEGYSLKTPESESEIGIVNSRAEFCDYNNDGNISWGECYKCFKDACSDDPDCNLLCSILDVAGSSCTLSIAAGCVVIAIMY